MAESKAIEYFVNEKLARCISITCNKFHHVEWRKEGLCENNYNRVNRELNELVKHRLPLWVKSIAMVLLMVLYMLIAGTLFAFVHFYYSSEATDHAFQVQAFLIGAVTVLLFIPWLCKKQDATMNRIKKEVLADLPSHAAYIERCKRVIKKIVESSSAQSASTG